MKKLYIIFALFSFAPIICMASGAATSNIWTKIWGQLMMITAEALALIILGIFMLLVLPMVLSMGKPIQAKE